MAMVQLELGKFGVKKPPAGEQGRKALLKNCLRSAADLIRRAQLYLEFPEVSAGGIDGNRCVALYVSLAFMNGVEDY